MRLLIFICFPIAVLGADFGTHTKPFLQNYCVGCHGPEKQKAKLRLDILSTDLTTIDVAESWQYVLDELNAAAMPPEDEKQPRNEELSDVLEELTFAIDDAKKKLYGKDQDIVLRRLNRREYVNTIHDLTGIRLEESDVPAEVALTDFDTNGKGLFMSSFMFDRYMDLGRIVIDKAIVPEYREGLDYQVFDGAFSELPDFDLLTPTTSGQTTKIDGKIQGMKSNFSIHYRGVIDIQRAGTYTFYAQSDNSLEIRIDGRRIVAYNGVDGVQERFAEIDLTTAKHRFEVGFSEGGGWTGLHVSWSGPGIKKQRIPRTVLLRRGDARPQFHVKRDEKGPNRADFFRRGIEQNKQTLKDSPTLNPQQRSRWMANIRGLERYLAYDEAKTHSLLSQHFTAGHPWQDKIRSDGLQAVHPDPNHRPGEWKVFEPGFYTVRVEVGAGDTQPGDIVEINLRHPDIATPKPFIVSARYPDMQTIESVFYFDKPHRISLGTTIKRTGKHIPFAAIKSMGIEGPVYQQWPPVSHQKIFPDSQGDGSDDRYAKDILRGFAIKAFRNRRPSRKFLDALLDAYSANRDKGMSLHEALKDPLTVILASPKFLYIVEEKGVLRKRLKEIELANRLSYFLWSTGPDTTLYDLAESGKLKKPAVIRQQVKRMLDDDKSLALANGFVPQWLELNKLDEINISHRLRGAYDNFARRDARLEPVHFFHTIASRNLSVENFIDSDFVVVNHVMKKYYGLPTNSNDDFELVKLPKNSGRGGILGQAAVLIITGNGERTSPVKRGNFVNTKILGMNSPSPPPNVPELPESDKAKPSTIREALDVHKTQAQCSSCHNRLDPSGFGLENFDAIGRWRDSAGHPNKDVDNDGQLPGGQKFTNIFEFKDALMTRKDDFARSLIEKLLEYALGREMSFADAAIVDGLLARSMANGYRFGDLLVDIAASPTFSEK